VYIITITTKQYTKAQHLQLTSLGSRIIWWLKKIFTMIKFYFSHKIYKNYTF